MIALLLAAGLAQAACPGFAPGPPDAPFQRPPAEGAVFVLELSADDAGDAAAVEALLDPLTARGLSATLLVPPSAAASLSPTLTAAADAGHLVAARVEVDPRGPLAERSRAAFDLWWALLRKERRLVRRAAHAPVRVVGVSPLTDPAELAAVQASVRVVLPLHGSGPAVRRISGFDGRRGRTWVLPAPKWPDGCGRALPAWTPAAFDLAAAVSGPGLPTRVLLPLEGARPELLAAWLDSAIAPAGARVASAIEAATQAPLAPKPGATTAPPARPVDRAMWEDAARRLLEGGRLPRTLPHGLSLTEAYAALVQVVAAPTPPASVRLAPLGPPADVARSTLPPEGLDLTAAAVREAAAALAPRLRGAVPTLITVEGRTLTSGEFLVALAAVALEQPPRATPSPPPDPFAAGAGWGRSGPPP